MKKACYLLCLPFFGYIHAAQDVTTYSLEELLKIKVTTASRREQSLEESPAYVEIITQADLQKRGYRDLSYLIDDLTGLQITRTYGDNYFNVLWRGIRHTIGSSHLVLIDGIRFNHLYNNEAEVLATFPISNIKHIEIVYGSASVAYGNDAVSGIINIITKTDTDESRGFIQVGENNQRVLDFNLSHQFENYQLHFSARLDDGDIDFSKADKYQWTNPALLQNTDIWGDFAQQYGSLSSPHKNRAIDIRVKNTNHEFALQYYRLGLGYGLEYTFDHSLPDAGLWYESDYSYHWKSNYKVSRNKSLKSLVRLRQSDIDNDSFFIESYLTTNDSGQTQRLVDASFWESTNDSLSAMFELDWQINSQWNLLTGIELENNDLQKAYNINFGPSLPPQQIQLANYNFPQPPTTDTVANNRIDTHQQSLYGLAQYTFPTKSSDATHSFHFGLRSDNHSEYDSEQSLRTGYVGSWPNTTVKLFYGEAFQEPPPRLLYGGWQGSGSDPNLNPRNAETIELNLIYQLKEILLSANLFRMTSENLFNATDSGAVNLGKGKVNGGDLRFQYRPRTKAIKQLSLWASYSWLSTEEQQFDVNQQLIWRNPGDFAEETFHFGSYVTFNDNWQLNIRGRTYGDRKPVHTNPLEKIDSFTSMDLNLTYSPEQWKNIAIALDISNLFDSTYFHPGVRSASASETNPGGLDNNGVWIGSESFYNSQIPQSGREARLTLYWEF